MVRPLTRRGIISGTALTSYVDDALNELEFLLGSTSTTSGALRASYGHPAPYTIPYIEIGNEDNVSSGCSTYASRFTAFYNAIHAAYPRRLSFDPNHRFHERGLVLTESVQGAVSEAVYMISLERTSDLVKLASYAPPPPLLEHFGLSTAPNSLTGSVSYYIQKLFASARGDTI
ncbi:putative alpha-L-arabinofuranosidase A, partial [Lachnellula arida]